jgi:hypothetical protein
MPRVHRPLGNLTVSIRRCGQAPREQADFPEGSGTILVVEMTSLYGHPDAPLLTLQSQFPPGSAVACKYAG